MRTGLMLRKVGMTSMFDDNGERIPLTVLQLDNCQVVAHRSEAKEGYNALVLGVKDVLSSKLSKPLRTVFLKKNLEPKLKMKEFRITQDNFIDVGSTILVDHFQVGQFVDVSAISIGKGFAGVMKRWNFRGLEASHGVSISHRSHGSTGGRQDPGKVFKGKKMAGHMGSKRITVQNLKIVDIDKENNLIVIKGSVPGAKDVWVSVKDAIKKCSNLMSKNI